MNFEQARFNMIEQQIRPWEVLDQRVLDLLRHVPREEFVPDAYRRLAFSDTSVPIGSGEVMMAPKVEARMLQSLAVEAGDKVLEIGTGSGYVTALLGKSGGQVLSVEIHPDLLQRAKQRLGNFGLSNITLELGDGARGWPAAAPFDVIAITASMPILDALLQQQLALGGRLFVITGQSPVMEASLITRVGEREWSTESLFETDIPPLVGVPEPPRFVF
jgi:protein-L-isoaspartate(D-aspartate) O-methyltransferase